MQDIRLQRQGDYYDIAVENGDFATVGGLETAIILSTFCDKRANQNEARQITARRGWVGDVYIAQNFSLGSKLWLLSQARLNGETINNCTNYLQDAFAWMVEDGYLKSVNVASKGDYAEQSITSRVTFVEPDGQQTTLQYKIFVATRFSSIE